MEFCEICNKAFKKENLRFHLKSQLHLKNAMKTESVEQENHDNESVNEVENEEQEQTGYNEIATRTDEYLSDFNNISFKVQEEVKPKEVKPNNALILKEIKHKFRQKKNDDDYSVKSDDLFSDRNKTPILGKSRREKLAKIRQYKLLFKEELKTFRIKKNSSEEDLDKYIDEIDAILATSKLDNFMTEAVHYVINVVEKMSLMTKDYDLTGLSETLRNNREFQDLIRILSIKYGTFQNVSHELQLAIIVASTSYICVMTNRQKKQLLQEQLKNQII